MCQDWDNISSSPVPSDEEDILLVDDSPPPTPSFNKTSGPSMQDVLDDLNLHLEESGNEEEPKIPSPPSPLRRPHPADPRMNHGKARPSTVPPSASRPPTPPPPRRPRPFHKMLYNKIVKDKFLAAAVYEKGELTYFDNLRDIFAPIFEYFSEETIVLTYMSENFQHAMLETVDNYKKWVRDNMSSVSTVPELIVKASKHRFDLMEALYQNIKDHFSDVVLNSPDFDLTVSEIHNRLIIRALPRVSVDIEEIPTPIPMSVDETFSSASTSSSPPAVSSFTLPPTVLTSTPVTPPPSTPKPATSPASTLPPSGSFSLTSSPTPMQSTPVTPPPSTPTPPTSPASTLPPSGSFSTTSSLNPPTITPSSSDTFIPLSSQQKGPSTSNPPSYINRNLTPKMVKLFRGRPSATIPLGYGWITIFPRFPNCWNCNGTHIGGYAQCPNPPMLVCMRCGTRNVSVASCPFCAEGWRHQGPYVRTESRNISRDELRRRQTYGRRHHPY